MSALAEALRYYADEHERDVGRAIGMTCDMRDAADELDAAYERGMRDVLSRLQEAERIDERLGFRLPGDSALYIALWGLECDLGDVLPPHPDQQLPPLRGRTRRGPRSP